MPDPQVALQVLGQDDAHLRIVERLASVSARARGGTIVLVGAQEDVAFAERVLRQVIQLARRGLPIRPTDVERAMRALNSNPEAVLEDALLDTVLVTERGKTIRPKTLAQKAYVVAMRSHDLVFSVGPAGTGKTYLAMAMAIGAFLRKEVRRIILARPAVEAGERLGFLPGDLAEKVNPYLRPLYDALHDMLDFRRVRRLIDDGEIEVAPLAFMRGRTLNSAFVILDEAQNTTREQMKMFLTRLGQDSRAVVTGDVTQVDLPAGTGSGLEDALQVLHGVEGIGFSVLTEADVVRHTLVQRIVRAYEAGARARGPGPPPTPEGP